MSTYGYTRVSTDRAASEGQSLAVQDRQIAGYALMLGLTVTKTFVEGGVTGSMPLADRPEGAALLALLKTGDVVITTKLDRMFRSSLDALETLKAIKAKGVSLHMIDLGGDVTSNGISKLIFTILAAVAEAERDRIRERISVVKADQRARGRYLGGIVPFGYQRIADALVPIPQQQDVIEAARRWRGAGAPLRAIQARIHVDHGVKLSLSTVHAMCEGSE